MPLCRIADKVLYFAHIPKTGGSSIEAYMAEKGPVALRVNRTHGWSATTPQHIPARLFSKMVPDAFYDLGFAVLRDPEAKILSTFKMRISKDHALWNPLTWLGLAWARARGREAYAIRFWKLRLSLDFDTWLRLALIWQRKNPYIYDGHLLPQVDYMHPGQKIFLFEDGIDQVFRWIDAVTGTEPIPGSFHEKKAKSHTVAGSAASRALIRKVYAEDYALIARHRAAIAAEAAETPEAALPGTPVVETAAHG